MTDGEFMALVDEAVQRRLALQEAMIADDFAYEAADQAASLVGYAYWPGLFLDRVRLAEDARMKEEGL